MSNSDMQRQALCSACWDKQHYDIYLKVKDLPDDVNITFNLKNPEGELCYACTMCVGKIKQIGRRIEERKKSKTE